MLLLVMYTYCEAFVSRTTCVHVHCHDVQGTDMYVYCLQFGRQHVSDEAQVPADGAAVPQRLRRQRHEPGDGPEELPERRAAPRLPLRQRARRRA